MRATKKERDYGLPPLTFAEAARILGITEETFILWLVGLVRPSPTLWSNWNNRDPEKRVPLPEKLRSRARRRGRSERPGEPVAAG